MDDQNTQRILEWYEKDGDALINDEEITHINLDKMRSFFHQDFDHEECMFGCYPVEQRQAEFLQPYINHNIKLNEYCYYLSIYADEQNVDQANHSIKHPPRFLKAFPDAKRVKSKTPI